jgi:hypothetical protein
MKIFQLEVMNQKNLLGIILVKHNFLVFFYIILH